MALRKKKEEIDRGIFRNDSVWDQLAFKKIHQLLGGRVKAIFCGSAPLDPNVMAFARAAMGAYVMEGEKESLVFREEVDVCLYVYIYNQLID